MRTLFYVFLTAVCLACNALGAADAAGAELKLDRLAKSGNWKELRREARKQLDAMSPDDPGAGSVWNKLCTGMFRGNEIVLYDEAFLKYAAGKFAGNTAFFAYADWDQVPGYGIILDDQFRRGPHRGNAGRRAASFRRDRAQVLALMAALIPKAETAAPPVRSRFFLCMAKLLLRNRNSGSSYKLQVLTDLRKLPDYDTAAGRVTSLSRPPVEPDGTPVFYRIPSGWDRAASDGERLRYVLSRAECDEANALWAEFLCGQFDLLAAEPQFRQEYYMTPAMKQYLYNLRENETVADLADGIRKITLPEDCNYIAICRKLGRYERLGGIYAARMQFEKAAEAFRKAGRSQYVQQLLESWGTPEPLQVASAGTEFTVPYHFRNAKKVTVRLYRVDTEKAVDRMLEMRKDPEIRFPGIRELAARPEKTKKLWRDLIGETPEKELSFELHPLPHHWETTEYLKFGRLAPGAFVAEFVPDGNRDSRVDTLIWAADCALTVQQGSRNGTVRLFLNDSASGRPVPGITLRIYSYYHRYERKLGKRQRITPEVLSFTTGRDGIAEFPRNVFREPGNSSLAARYILAEMPGKRTVLSTYRFFDGGGLAPDGSLRTFIITDKTVYKPGDAIAISGYLRQPVYSGIPVRYTGKTVTLHFLDPQYRESFKKTVPFDAASQSFTAEISLPADALLGRWRVKLENIPGGISFKVEEYKKPEYLLAVATPDGPVKAGEKMRIAIGAKYYFGAPVTDAEVSYKVFREETAPVWPFAFVWNWLYGERYALCTASYQDPKVRSINSGRVMIRDGKGKTDARGELVIAIDTAEAVVKYGNRDFRYTVEAEVRDSANRAVSGSGSVIAAVKPFAVSIYTPWGFAKTGALQRVEVAARTPDGKPVTGEGTLRIYRRALNRNGVPERTGAPLKTIRFTPGGPEKPAFILNEEGVYELEAEVAVSPKTVSVKESMPFFVVGEKKGAPLFGEYPVSIAADKPVYRPGEKAQILVTCSEPGRTVYFITRSERNAEIRCVTLEGYSKLFTIPVEKGDQPNFFVDVMSYQAGKMLTLRKEIIVPPEKKILSVSAVPAADKVKPGTVLPLRIRVTGLDGKPVSGEVAVTVYDKSLEAVSASPVPAIRPFFWGWTRHCSLQFRSSLEYGGSLHIPFRMMYRNIAGGFAIPFYSDDGPGFFGYYGRRENRVYKSGCVCAAAAPMMSRGADAADAAEMAEMAEPAEVSGNAVRTNFLDRAFWAGRIHLPGSGETTVRVPVPDDLTTWVVRVWGLTPDTRVGEARTEFIVSKDLIARLELPRFMVQGDTVRAVVTISNTAAGALDKVETALTAPGLMQSVHTQSVTVRSGGSASYGVPLKAAEAGEYTLTLSAKSGSASDALKLKLPVLVKGIARQVNSCGRLDAGKRKAEITLDIPEKRRPETTAFALYLSPGAAKNMIELLPYLAADDSGDVFGVVNRFMPALSAKLALQKLGIRWEDAAPEKTSRDPLYAEYMQRYARSVPSFTAADFDRVTAESLRMIARMVNSDGGWGWFGAYREQSWADTTAYVVDALLEVRDKVPRRLAGNGVAWLVRHAEKRVREIRKHRCPGNTDALVARVLAKAGKPNKELMNLCYEHRAEWLAPYGYAMLALAYGRDTEEAKMLIRNLEQFLKVDEENGTAYLNIPSACCFFWYGNENETLAAYLELLLREDPKSVTAQKAANYLVTSVRNSPWRNSTRALGAAVRALANYIVASGEGKPDFTVTVRDGAEVHKYVFHARNMWRNTGPALFLPAGKLKSGKRVIGLEFSGTGALYWNGMLNCFSLEDEIKPAGLEMKIRRNYYRLVEDTESSALLAGKKGGVIRENTLRYRRIPLREGDTVKPGDLVEVELVSTAKNDYDYVVFQDAMPAGFEYVDPVSGWQRDWGAPMYAEYRERGARFYLRNMARGESNAFYRIRAQLCGKVTALPARGYGIYAPELQCNGAQQTLKTGY